MAKKFLDILADAYEEDELDALIPAKRKAVHQKAKDSADASQAGAGHRKKRFLEQISDNLPEAPKGKGRKSLLETMEEALDNQAFDDIFPERPTQQYLDREQKALESRFSTMITTEVLTRARQIAELKGIRVKDVINTALRIYVEREWENLQDD
jgi:hypothetical protein